MISKRVQLGVIVDGVINNFTNLPIKKPITMSSKYSKTGVKSGTGTGATTNSVNGRQLLPPMRYKTFTWPNNPHECKYAVDKAFAKHKYPELAGVELEDMDNNAAVISGSGEFFGKNAYSYWNNLLSVFSEHGVGEFYHPLYTNVTRALMTKLEMNLEPRENYVSYTFEFVAEDILPWIKTSTLSASKWTTTSGETTTPTVVKPEDTKPTTTTPSGGGWGGGGGLDQVHGDTPTSVATQNGTITIGDVVICNGYGYYDSYGTNPHTGLLQNKQLVVTAVNYGSEFPIHVGSMGWMRLSDVTKGSTVSSNDYNPYAAPTVQSGTTGNTGYTATGATDSYTTYTVKSGDNLTKIASMYGTSWNRIAQLNSLKNPNLIFPGQQLRIPQ